MTLIPRTNQILVQIRDAHAKGAIIRPESTGTLMPYGHVLKVGPDVPKDITPGSDILFLFSNFNGFDQSKGIGFVPSDCVFAFLTDIPVVDDEPNNVLHILHPSA